MRYAYAGFPRSLNGINTFVSVMDERQAGTKQIRPRNCWRRSSAAGAVSAPPCKAVAVTSPGSLRLM